MILRTAVLAAYLAVLVAAFALQIIFPVLAIYVFYGLLFWLFASFFLFRLPGMSRPIPGSGAASGAPWPTSPGASASSPLPSTTPAIQLEFCAFCGADLPIGSASCPACGHAIRAF